jgi:hypothetical protein
MRHVPDNVLHDVARAAAALAHLPDTDDRALRALAWACGNCRRRVNAPNEMRGARSYGFAAATEGLIGLGTEGMPMPAGIASAKLWNALSVFAAVVGGHGNDPTRGAYGFHHGGCAPNWALALEPSCWIGRWAFYGGAPSVKIESPQSLGSAGFPP